MYERIRDLREDRDLKQRQLSDYLHCSQQVYSNYELGQRDIPTQDKVNRLLAIEAEKQNAEICDYVVKMETPQQAAEEILSSLHLM